MNRRAILLAEDNSDDAFLMQRAFQAVGVTNPVVRLSDGEEAIDFFSRPEAIDETQRPRLMLLDVKLPYRSGLDVLEWIRRQREFRGLAIIMLTSSTEPGDVARALELGANAYIMKPAAYTDLTQLASSIRDFWLRYHYAG